MRRRSSGVVYRLCKPVPLNSFRRLVSNPQFTHFKHRPKY